MSDSSPPVLDYAVLESLRESVGGDDAFVADLVETYLADSRDQLGAIERAVAAADAAALVRPAHTLKSASFTLGATRLGELSRILEQRARSDDLDGIAGIAGEAREEWQAASAALTEWLADHGGGRR